MLCCLSVPLTRASAPQRTRAPSTYLQIQERLQETYDAICQLASLIDARQNARRSEKPWQGEIDATGDLTSVTVTGVIESAPGFTRRTFTPLTKTSLTWCHTEKEALASRPAVERCLRTLPSSRSAIDSLQAMPRRKLEMPQHSQNTAST